jgi:hypothetical protein
MDASGTVAGAIVFSRWRGRNYVRRHAIPSNPRTALQTGVRSAFRFLTQGWKDIDPSVQALWTTQGDVTRVTGLNELVAQNIRRLREGRVWMYTPAIIVPDVTTEINFLTPSPLSRAIQLDWTYSSVNANNWGVELHMSLSTGFSMSIASLIYAVPVVTQQLIITGLTPGVPYYFRAKVFSTELSYGAFPAEVNATPNP